MLCFALLSSHSGDALAHMLEWGVNKFRWVYKKAGEAASVKRERAALLTN